MGEDVQTGQSIVAKEPRVTGNPQTDRLNLQKLAVEGDILEFLGREHTKSDNLVSFVDRFNVGSVPILVTGFAKGDLMERMGAGTPFDEKTAVAYTGKLLDAIGYIHQRNIIHRDVRPKNILLDRSDGGLTLIDFGTAKFFNLQVDAPEAVIAPGGYSPPEHYKLGYSPQGDLWSVGATLFFALTGQHPLLVLGAYPQHPMPADPRKVISRVSGHLAEVVIKSMQVEPSSRFLNAAEMKQALQGVAPKRRANPVLSIRNDEILIKTPRVIIGRNEQLDHLYEHTTSTGSMEHLEMLEEKSTVEVSSDKTVIKVVDPGRYISIVHAEIYEAGKNWFVKDLGSLNGTAVLTDSGWKSIHKGHWVEGSAYPLTGRDILSLGFGDRGPYLVLSFLA